MSRTISISLASTTGWSVGDVIWIEHACCVIDRVTPTQLTAHEATQLFRMYQIVLAHVRRVKRAVLTKFDKFTAWMGIDEE